MGYRIRYGVRGSAGVRPWMVVLGVLLWVAVVFREAADPAAWGELLESLRAGEELYAVIARFCGRLLHG